MSGIVEPLRLGYGKNVPGVRQARQIARESRQKIVLEYLRKNPDGVYESQLREHLKVSQNPMKVLIDQLVRQKKVRYELVPVQGGKHARVYFPYGQKEAGL